MELGEAELIRGIVHGFAAAYDTLRPAAATVSDPHLDGLAVAEQVLVSKPRKSPVI